MNTEQALRGDGAPFLARDFIAIETGLHLAVVANGEEDGRVLAYPRYVRDRAGTRKLGSDEARAILQREYAEFQFRSVQRDVVLCGVPSEQVRRHFIPSERLREVCDTPTDDPLLRATHWAATILGEATRGKTNAPPSWLGVTGSVLIGAHGKRSDIDLVVYGRQNFRKARDRLRDALETGQADGLDETMWRDAYQRRGCSLTFDEYLWHEQRKLNKFSCQGKKIDVSCVDREPVQLQRPGRKMGRRVIQAVVEDAELGFDYPACYRVQHPEIGEIVSFTPTYTGQAWPGETIEAAGWAEVSTDGLMRLIVGSSREAPGEYIKVVKVH